MGRKDLERKVGAGATRLQQAMAELATLSDMLQQSRLVGPELRALEQQLDKLGEAMLRIEDAVGVATPQSLFE